MRMNLFRALLLAAMAAPSVADAQSDGARGTPPISPPGGTYYKAPVVVKLSPPGGDALLRYTLDGTEPDATSKQYMGPISLQRTGTVKVRSFRQGKPEGVVSTAAYTIEPAVVFDPLKASTLGRAMGKGQFLPEGGWRSGGGLLVYDAGRPITDGYIEVTMRGLQAPAQKVDKTHPLAGWESKNSYGHYEEKGSFFNWRVGAGYEVFKVLAASKSIGTRVEERVGTPAAVNDGKPHVYRVAWKGGKLDFLFDGKELRSWTMDRFQLQFFTLGRDLQYSETCDPAPVFSDVKIVDRAAPAPKRGAN